MEGRIQETAKPKKGCATAKQKKNTPKNGGRAKGKPRRNVGQDKQESVGEVKRKATKKGSPSNNGGAKCK